MSEADLARLALAKRAYHAAQPSEAEVQTGVRRARLALRRPKSRSNWFSKGLVFVVLAIGSLAYAKPHALGELVDSVLPGAGTRATKSGQRLVVAADDARGSEHLGQLVAPRAAPRAVAASTHEAPVALPPAAASPSLESMRGSDTAPKRNHAERAASAAATAAGPRAAAPGSADTEEIGSEGSKWGRVGQALASGDDRRALTVLDELSQSDDARTRDKADLGRAQLMLAHANHDAGCALARTLMNRRAGSRIERQAQTLLKGCSR